MRTKSCLLCPRKFWTYGGLARHARTHYWAQVWASRQMIAERRLAELDSQECHICRTWAEEAKAEKEAPMRDYDQMIERMCEADGVRMASGQHIDSPIPRHHTDHENIPDGWDQCPDCGGSWDASIINGCRFCRIYGKPADPWIDRRDNDR